MPVSASLRHPVNGFLDAADARPSICAEGGLSQRRVTVDYFVLLQATLQVRGDKIPTPHAHDGGIGDRRERAQGRGAHSGAECLLRNRYLCPIGAYLYTPVAREEPTGCLSAAGTRRATVGRVRVARARGRPQRPSGDRARQPMAERR
eukprot:1612750-Pleurochrysis_carterae.AAC.1